MRITPILIEKPSGPPRSMDNIKENSIITMLIRIALSFLIYPDLSRPKE
jgi:hypothetical protein